MIYYDTIKDICLAAKKLIPGWPMKVFAKDVANIILGRNSYANDDAVLNSIISDTAVSITLGSHLTRTSAFQYNTQLKELTVNGNIGSLAASAIPNLEKIKYNTATGSGACEYCENLMEVTKTSYSFNASEFLGCTSLSVIYLVNPDRNSSNGAWSFCDQCASLQHIYDVDANGDILGETIFSSTAYSAFKESSYYPMLTTDAVLGVDTFRHNTGVTKVEGRYNFSTSNNVYAECPNLTEASFICKRGTTSTSHFVPYYKSQFANCTSLTKYTIKGEVRDTSFAETFAGCVNLDTVIIDINTTAPLSLSNSSAFKDTKIAKKQGYIYVPADMVTKYQMATNWAQYASQFRAIGG